MQNVLDQFFVKSDVSLSDEGDDNANTDVYTFALPEDVEFWTLELIPMTSKIGFRIKHKNSPIPTCITMEDKVTHVTHSQGDQIHVQCESFQCDNPYRFAILIDNRIHPFNVSSCIESLNNTDYEKLMKEMEEDFNRGYWQGKNKRPLSAKSVAEKAQQILFSVDKMTAVLEALAKEKKEAPRALTPFTSQGSVRSGSGRKSSRPTPEPSTRQLRKRPQNEVDPTPTSSRAKRKKPAAQEEVEDSGLASAVTTVPRDRKPGEAEVDYTESANNFKNFWTECTECYVLPKVDDKVTISIDKLERAPDTHTIRAFEEFGVGKLMHYYIEMSDKHTRQTICIMPKGLTVKPKSWDEIKDGEFIIINGQHSVEASKRMQNDDSVDQNVKDFFKTWNAFVVWSLDLNKLRTISAFYNRCNHFSIFSPTWATNILASRSLWLFYGRPSVPLPQSEIGKSARHRALAAQNDARWKVLTIGSSGFGIMI